jgi:hypothetical protein
MQGVFDYKGGAMWDMPQNGFDWWSVCSQISGGGSTLMWLPVLTACWLTAMSAEATAQQSWNRRPTHHQVQRIH